MSWLNKQIDEFFEKRKIDKKTDKVFLTPHKRDKHIVNTPSEMDWFLQQYIAAADDYQKNGRRYFVVVDVEASSKKAHYWHEKELRRSGESGKEIEDRKRVMSQLRGRSEWKDARKRVTLLGKPS